MSLAWYRVVPFACPGCGRRLAVERDQVRGGEVVTCQDCNTDIRLVARGTAGPVADPADGPITVELPDV